MEADNQEVRLMVLLHSQKKPSTSTAGGASEFTELEKGLKDKHMLSN